MPKKSKSAEDDKKTNNVDVQQESITDVKTELDKEYAPKKLTKEELFEQEVERRLAERLKEKEEEIEAMKLTNYAAANNLLRKKSFISRLYNLNVKERWLSLFRDEDDVMSNDQIWEKIRYSDIDDRKDRG